MLAKCAPNGSARSSTAIEIIWRWPRVICFIPVPIEDARSWPRFKYLPASVFPLAFEHQARVLGRQPAHFGQRTCPALGIGGNGVAHCRGNVLDAALSSDARGYSLATRVLDYFPRDHSWLDVGVPKQRGFGL